MISLRQWSGFRRCSCNSVDRALAPNAHIASREDGLQHHTSQHAMRVLQKWVKGKRCRAWGGLCQVTWGLLWGDGTWADVFTGLGCKLGEDLVQKSSGRGPDIARLHDGKDYKTTWWLKNQEKMCQLRSRAEHVENRGKAKGGKGLTRPRDIAQDLRAGVWLVLLEGCHTHPFTMSAVNSHGNRRRGWLEQFYSW